MARNCVEALQHVRQMRGGTESHLLRCSDDQLYVVKFQGNPQGTRVLANEWLATGLARLVGLPIPPCATVNVDSFLIQSTSELASCHAGIQFGSLYVAGHSSHIWDYMPPQMFPKVSNVKDFYAALAFDKWVSNLDFRQAVFCPTPRGRYVASFIDQGRCFSGTEWTFRDIARCGLYHSWNIYAGLTDWDCFEPVLSNIETMDDDAVWHIVSEIPPEWIDDQACLEVLVALLLKRRQRLRPLLQDMHFALPEAFPNWRGSSRSALPSCTTIPAVTRGKHERSARRRRAG